MMNLSLVARCCLLVLFPFAVGAAVKKAIGTINVVNLAPINGTWQSPVLAMIHDGSFEIYNLTEPASVEVERMAEDMNPWPMVEKFISSPGALWFGLVGDTPIPPFGGSTELDFEFEYEVGTAYYFSYMTMILPSNDAWLSDIDPMAYPIIDGEGGVLNVSILADGFEALSAGTEVNDEIPEHTAFLAQTQPDAGIPVLGGVVLEHRGFAPAVDGGILSYPEFSAADFKVEGYEFISIEARITETDSVRPSTPTTRSPAMAPSRRPAASTSPTGAFSLTSSEPQACLTIADIICSSDDFVILCNVTKAGGMVDAFQDGEWTVFAPIDDSFAVIPSDALMDLLDDPQSLKNLLMYHSVADEILFSSDLPCVAGDNLIEMANGMFTRTICDDDTPKYQKGDENDEDDMPEIIRRDVEACNGIIHVLDALLFYD